MLLLLLVDEDRKKERKKERKMEREEERKCRTEREKGRQLLVLRSGAAPLLTESYCFYWVY